MEPLQTWWTTELYPTSDEDNFGVVGNFEVVKAADAQATIAALQARVKELEDEGKTYQEVLRQAYTVQNELTQRTAERDTARRRVDELEAREVDVVLLRDDLEQRTAECEALQVDNRTYINERHENMKQIEQLQADLAQRAAELERRTDECNEISKMYVEVQAELERVRGELAEERAMMLLTNEVLIPSLQHRQGMEG